MSFKVKITTAHSTVNQCGLSSKRCPFLSPPINPFNHSLGPPLLLLCGSKCKWKSCFRVCNHASCLEVLYAQSGQELNAYGGMLTGVRALGPCFAGFDGGKGKVVVSDTKMESESTFLVKPHLLMSFSVSVMVLSGDKTSSSSILLVTRVTG